MLAGIDYGLGKVNIDHETGIRYGVIHHSVLGQAWYDSCEGDYGDPTCPKCGSPVIEYAHAKHNRKAGYGGYGQGQDPLTVTLCCADYACESCQLTFWGDHVWPELPLAWTFKDSEYSMVQYGDDCDIFIIKSPYYTYCALCSPCAPGAGYIMSQMDEATGIKAYCPSPDWFEDDCPYTVYSVEEDV